MTINKFGLSRNITPSVKLEIRKACGFGCVICGSAFYTYEHIDPEFHGAKEHDPQKMTLLCGACQLSVSKGFWSKEKVINARKNPKCLQQGYTSGFFDVSEPLGVNIGRIYFSNENVTKNLLRIDGKNVLSIKRAENEPPQLSGVFLDENGNILFEIKDNEFFGNPEAWNIETVGKKIIIKDQAGQVYLKIRVTPPHIISIEKINLKYGACVISTDEETGKILLATSSGAHIDASAGMIITGGPVTIEDGQIKFENGSMVLLAQEGIPLNPLNFERYLQTGQISSI